MSSNIQLAPELAGSIPVASAAGKKRLFLDTSDGQLKTKDSVGTVEAIAGSVAPWTHNAIINNAASPYAATINETVKVDPSSGAVQVDLPTAAGIAGQLLKVINVTTDVTTITVNPVGLETIDGASSYMMNTPRERVWLESDGTNWLVVG